MQGIKLWKIISLSENIVFGFFGREVDVRLSWVKVSRFLYQIHRRNYSTDRKEFLISEIPKDNKDYYVPNSKITSIGSPWLEWFVGFTDAKGCFLISPKTAHSFEFIFKIKLHIKDQGGLIYNPKYIRNRKSYSEP